MKHKLPAFQWYPKQWLGDDKVMLMDWDARGMHFHLINISWEQAIPGTIPHDQLVIRRWLKNPSSTVWKRVWPQILAAWKIWGKNDDLLYSRGVLREFRKIKSFSKKQKENAQKRWHPRRKKGDAMAYATAMPRHHSGNARAGNALQSSSTEVEEDKEEMRKVTPRSAPPDAPATRGSNLLVSDEPPKNGFPNSLNLGFRSSRQPHDEYGWEHLERTLSDEDRVRSKMREKSYREKNVMVRTPAVMRSGEDDVF